MRTNQTPQAQEDDRWLQAYNNAAERLFGKVEGDTLTDEQDAKCIAAADRETAAEGYVNEFAPADPFDGIPNADGSEDYQPEYPEHDCPRDAFLDDPITQAYGVGSEMVHLIPCAICDAEQS